MNKINTNKSLKKPLYESFTISQLEDKKRQARISKIAATCLGIFSIATIILIAIALPTIPLLLALPITLACEISLVISWPLMAHFDYCLQKINNAIVEKKKLENDKYLNFIDNSLPLK